MEFTPELTAFQGTIISADNVYSFSKLTAKGGNEKQIDYVINCIKSFLQKENYVSGNAVVQEKEDKMRKLALFMILNADIPVLQEKVDMEGIHSVVWTIPTIPTCLLSELLWNLHLEKFIYEVIAFSCPNLALELTSSLVENLKYCTPSTCLERLKIISTACYRLISRLHFYKFENKMLCDILTCAYDNIEKCLKYFITPPNAGKLMFLSKDEQYKCKGNYLHAMLTLMYDCLEQYSANPKFTSEDFDEIYLLTFDLDTLSSNTGTNQKKSQDILDCLDKCHMSFMDKCQELVMDVSVDIFCAWSEFEEDGKSMQQTIGELCYKLREKLLTINSISEHPLVTMIQQISCDPVNVEDIINTADNHTIIENINKDSDRKEWVRALIHRHKLCHDQTLVENLVSNLNILNNEECYTLYKICQNHLNNYSENIESVELLAFKAFQSCSNDTKYEILEQRFQNNCFYDMTETAEFNNMMTEIFNKFIVSPDSDLSDVLDVFIQIPLKVYTKIFLLAAENAQQTEIMFRVMKLLEKFANHFYSHETEPCLIGIVKNILENHLDTEVKQENFVKFLSFLKSANIISGTKLLLLIVMPSLYKALLSNDIESINIQCRLLSDVYTLPELVQYRAPMLAMLAQVLDTVRWKLDTFVPLGPSTLQLALKLQTSLFDTYDLEIPDKEANWLRSKLKNMQPLNLYYYRRLWNHTDKSFIEAVSDLSVSKETDMTQLAAWLSLVICSSTQKEWCSVWDNLTMYGDTVTLDIFHEVLALVTQTEAQNHTDKTWGCLLNCYRNFIFIIRYKFFKEPLSDNQVSTAINKIATLVNLVAEENFIELGTVLLPLFVYLVERKNDYTIDVQQSLQSALKHSKFADTFNNIFTNGAT